MRNYCKTLGTLAAVSALVAGKAAAEVEYELHTGWSNEYLYRGLNLGHNLIEVGADVKAEVSGIGLSAGAWYGSFDNSKLPTVLKQDVGELDLYAQVSKDFHILTGSVGYIYRYFESNGHDAKQENPPTQEIVFTLSRQICYGVEGSLTYFWGVEGQNDGYSEFALSRSFELSPCVALNCSTRLGYQIEQGQLSALTTKVSLDWAFVARAKLSPFVAYSIALCDDPDTWYRGSENQLVGGMMLSVGF
ncbi:MAG: TorF family putative porin [Verrucomicrobiota bacterium]